MRNNFSRASSNELCRGGLGRKTAGTGAALVAAGAALGAMTGQASATPSGLVFYNSTDIYPKGTVHFDLDSVGKGIKTDVFTSTGFEYGAGPDKDGLFGRTELGFDYLLSVGGSAPSGVSTSDRVALNVKTQLYNNDTSKVRVVAGVGGVGHKKLFPSYQGFLLASKAFEWGRVHAGVAHYFRGDPLTKTALQLSYDKALNKKFIFAADFQTGKGNFFAPGIIYLPNARSDFELGIGRANSSSVSPRTQVYLAYDYSF